MHPRVVHCKKAPCDFYVGRPSICGNPWSHKPDTHALFLVASRTEAVQAFEDWLRGMNHKNTLQEKRLKILRLLPTLHKKILGCWCAPENCHADVIARLVDEMHIKEIRFDKTYPVQLSRYEIVKVGFGATADLSPDDDLDQAQSALREFVEATLQDDITKLLNLTNEDLKSEPKSAK